MSPRDDTTPPFVVRDADRRKQERPFEGSDRRKAERRARG